MAEMNLSKYGITGTTEIVHNPSYELLFEEETKPGLEGFEKGQVSELGAVNVMTCLLYTSIIRKLQNILEHIMSLEEKKRYFEKITLDSMWHNKKQ